MQKNISTEQNTLSDTMSYDGQNVLRYEIHYPQFDSKQFSKAANRMNVYYFSRAAAFERYCRKKLFSMAVEQYRFSQQEGYPVMQYEAICDYEITYNDDCTLSMYADQYIYSGGANGTTTRSAQTWSLKNGRQLPLSRYVRDTKWLIGRIVSQIYAQIESGQGNYFDDAEQNAEEEFDKDNFYLTPDGLTVFYQMYAIAPHSSGIVQFPIPYQKGTVMRPRC